jgi:hypothetical protein
LIDPDSRASLLVMPRKKTSELALFEAVHAMDMRLNPSLGMMPGELIQCAPPQVKPRGDRRVWLRKNNGLTVRLESGHNDDETPVGLPYGPKTRILLGYCARKIKQTGDAVVDLGPSQNGFMDELGFLSKSAGSTGNKKIVAEQAIRIVNANLTVRWADDHPNRYRGGGMRFADSWDMWWDRSKNPTHPVRGSWIKFSQLFVDMVEKASPVNLEAMVLLGQSALAQDLYTAWSNRLYRIDPNKPVRLNKRQLAVQFGNGPMPDDPGKVSDFISETWRNIKNQVPAVKKVYWQANVEQLDDGLRLHHSPPHVPPRGGHYQARELRAESAEERRMAAIAADRGQLALPIG